MGWITRTYPTSAQICAEFPLVVVSEKLHIVLRSFYPSWDTHRSLFLFRRKSTWGKVWTQYPVLLRITDRKPWSLICAYLCLCTGVIQSISRQDNLGHRDHRLYLRVPHLSVSDQKNLPEDVLQSNNKHLTSSVWHIWTKFWILYKKMILLSPLLKGQIHFSNSICRLTSYFLLTSLRSQLPLGLWEAWLWTNLSSFKQTCFPFHRITQLFLSLPFSLQKNKTKNMLLGDTVTCHILDPICQAHSNLQYSFVREQ